MVGYYSYLSNKEVDNQEEIVVTNEEVSKLISRNLEDAYYPEFPRGVVEFYSRIVKAYYYTELSDEEIEALGAQARKLFDTELLDKNPEENFYSSLKLDIEMYNELERRIYDYTIEDSSEIDMFTFEGEQYAIVTAGYLMREKGSVVTIYEDYTLRKDEHGRWKILFWDQSMLME